MRSEVGTNHTRRKKLALSSWGAALVMAGLTAGTTPAAAQITSTSSTTPSTTPITVRLIEWDLPQQMDNVPGGMVVDVQGDRNRLWFVTRTQAGDAPRVYRVELRGDKKNKDTAEWYSWELDPLASGVANGLRKVRSSKDGRFIFVHTTEAMQRIDVTTCYPIASTVSIAGFYPTAECPRRTWPHAQPAFDPRTPGLTGSDVAVDDYGNVYAAVAVNEGPEQSFIQRLNPGSNLVTRWYVGGSAGQCILAAESAPCLSGVDIDRSGRYVYFSQPEGGPNGTLGEGAIAELDTKYNSMRVWPFSTLNAELKDPTPVVEPRQLHVDDDGRIWVVTGSGHLVSLDPRNNRMTRHLVPDASRDLFGVSPDSSLIGFTNTDATENTVGFLKPNRNFVPVPPETVGVLYQTFKPVFDDGKANRTNGRTSPTSKKAMGRRTTTPDGTFVEAQIATGTPSGSAYTSPTPSMMPLGITPDRNASAGTFFYAVGDPGDVAFNRIGRARLPRNNIKARIERDDDDIDDDGKRADADDDVDDDGIPNAMDGDNDNDGTPDVSDDDDDDDGIEDDFDSKDKKESKQSSQQDVSSGQYAQDAFTVNPSTLLVVASATSTDLLAPVSVEILNEAGQIVASSLASPGSAVITFAPPAAGGSYTLRVKNQSVGLATLSTKILTRELWPVAALGGGL
jgi:hypothetical protein